MKNIKIKRGLMYILVLLPAVVCSGCILINSSKVAGTWLGMEKLPNSAMSALTAEFKLDAEGNFTAKFTNAEGTQESVSGTYTYTAERSFAFSPEEYGTMTFKIKKDSGTSVKICTYRVTATTLYLNNWLDNEGKISNLTLYR